MAKLTLTDGTIFEGTTEEIFAITEKFGAKSEVPEAESLEVGDSVIISGKSIFGVDLDGKLGSYEGASIYYAPAHAQVRVPNEKGYVVKYANIRKATDGEVAEAKAKAEAARKEAVFTQAGRKPNEYRKGDIVRFTPFEGARVHGLAEYPGIITEVGVGGVGNAYLKIPEGITSGRGTHTLAKEMEIVIFVESRLDRN